MLLPYTTDRPPRNPPLAVVMMVLSNFLLFGIFAAAVFLKGPDAPVVWYANLSLVPAFPHPWSFVTYAFLHADIVHLSLNMLALWVFGGGVEGAIGWRKFIGLYLVGAVVTGAIQVAMERLLAAGGSSIPIVGASGAAAVMVGVFAVRFYRADIRFLGLPWRVPAVLLLAVALIGEMAVGLIQVLRRDLAGHTAAHWAHIGGFLLGMVWAQAGRLGRTGRRDYLEEEARAALDRGSPLAAAHRWEAVLALHPGDLSARAELGIAQMEAGDREQGRQRLEAVIEEMLRQSDRAAAAVWYARLTDLAPESSLPSSQLLSLAAALEEIGRPLESLNTLDRIVVLEPPAAECEIALLRAGLLLLRKLDRPTDSAARMEQFLADFPDTRWRSFAEAALKEAKSRAGAES